MMMSLHVDVRQQQQLQQPRVLHFPAEGGAKVQLILRTTSGQQQQPTLPTAPIAIPVNNTTAAALEIFPSPPIDIMPSHRHQARLGAAAAAAVPTLEAEAAAAAALAHMSSSVSSTGSSSAYSCSSPSPPPLHHAATITSPYHARPHQHQQLADLRPLQQLQLQQLKKTPYNRLNRRLSEGSCGARQRPMVAQAPPSSTSPVLQPHHPALVARKSSPALQSDQPRVPPQPPSSATPSPTFALSSPTNDQRNCTRCGGELSSRCLMQTCTSSSSNPLLMQSLANVDPQVVCHNCGRELTTKCILTMCKKGQ